MCSHTFTTAMTLYRSGTLTLEQAAVRAGCSESVMRKSLCAHGIEVREDRTGTVADAVEGAAGAD